MVTATNVEQEFRQEKSEANKKFLKYVLKVHPGLSIRWVGISWSLQRLATDLNFRGLNPSGGAMFTAPVQTGFGTKPTSHSIKIGLFQEG
jgi:hypothetical protein